MKRISEALAFQNVLAPQSVAASTDKTTAYVDVSGVEEIVFLVSAAALGKGKGLTVSLLASGDSGGDGAEEIGKATFTDSVGHRPPACGGDVQGERPQRAVWWPSSSATMRRPRWPAA